ncbi:MAG: hypothetical protein V7731_18875 [Amphritea sp.]
MKSILALFSGLLLALVISLPVGASGFTGHGSPALIGGRIFPLTTTENLNDLRIKVTAASIGRVGVVRLDNKRVYCKALFTSGPEKIGMRRAHLDPGKTATMAKTVWRYASRMNIEITCTEPRS